MVLIGILKATEKKDTHAIVGSIYENQTSENQPLLNERNSNLTEEPQDELETKPNTSINIYKLPVQFWSLCVVIL
jgi:hypothetical protein